MAEYYVYIHRRQDTNEIFYVGKGHDKRAWDFKYSRNIYCQRIYNLTSIKVEIIKDNLTEEQAFSLEKRFIRELKNIGLAQANFHEGGFGGNSWKFMPEEQQLFLKKKFSQSHLGKSHSSETRRKMSESGKQSKHPLKRCIKVIENDTFLLFPSLKSAAEYCCCNRKTVYKYLDTGKIFQNKFIFEEEKK